MLLFKVIWWCTQEDNKWAASRIHTILCDRDAAFELWFELKKSWPHIEIYDLDGSKQSPERGIDSVVGSHP